MSICIAPRWILKPLVDDFLVVDVVQGPLSCFPPTLSPGFTWDMPYLKDSFENFCGQGAAGLVDYLDCVTFGRWNVNRGGGGASGGTQVVVCNDVSPPLLFRAFPGHTKLLLL